MTTEHKLKAIREKCAERIAYAESNATDLYGGDAIAGWESTIAAIDLLTDNGSDYVTYEQESKEIISAWEGLA